MTSEGTIEKTGKIRVFLRVRPPTGQELARKDQFDVIFTDKTNQTSHDSIVLKTAPRGSRARCFRKFTYSGVFGPECTQMNVFDSVGYSAVTDAMRGCHSLVLCFGQTGSGKSYTIANLNPGREGLVYRCLRDLYARLDSQSEMLAYTTSVSLSCVQLCNEKLTDMLASADSPVPLSLRNVTHCNGAVEICGASVVPSDTFESAVGVYCQASKAAVLASTPMNPQSSRSHTLFTVNVIRTQVPSHASTSKKRKAPRHLFGRMLFVDLAGSECLAKVEDVEVEAVRSQFKGPSNTVADIARRTNPNINKSLLVLGRVISCLAESEGSAVSPVATPSRGRHIPFRDSKLTRLLQYVLQGSGHTSLILAVSPSRYNYGETVAALEFGTRADRVPQGGLVHSYSVPDLICESESGSDGAETPYSRTHRIAGASAASARRSGSADPAVRRRAVSLERRRCEDGTEESLDVEKIRAENMMLRKYVSASHQSLKELEKRIDVLKDMKKENRKLKKVVALLTRDAADPLESSVSPNPDHKLSENHPIGCRHPSPFGTHEAELDSIAARPISSPLCPCHGTSNRPILSVITNSSNTQSLSAPQPSRKESFPNTSLSDFVTPLAPHVRSGVQRTSFGCAPESDTPADGNACKSSEFAVLKGNQPLSAEADIVTLLMAAHNELRENAENHNISIISDRAEMEMQRHLTFLQVSGVLLFVFCFHLLHSRYLVEIISQSQLRPRQSLHES